MMAHWLGAKAGRAFQRVSIPTDANNRYVVGMAAARVRFALAATAILSRIDDPLSEQE